MLFLWVERSITPAFLTSYCGRWFELVWFDSLFLNLLKISTSYFFTYCFSFFCSLIRLSKSLPSCSAERFFSLLSMSLTVDVSYWPAPLLSKVMIFLGNYYPPFASYIAFLTRAPPTAPLPIFETFLAGAEFSSKSLLFPEKPNSSKMFDDLTGADCLNLGFRSVNIQSMRVSTICTCY